MVQDPATEALLRAHTWHMVFETDKRYGCERGILQVAPFTALPYTQSSCLDYPTDSISNASKSLPSRHPSQVLADTKCNRIELLQQSGSGCHGVEPRNSVSAHRMAKPAHLCSSGVLAHKHESPASASAGLSPLENHLKLEPVNPSFKSRNAVHGACHHMT